MTSNIYLERIIKHVAFENRFYPHLLPFDIPLWKRFLDKYAHQYIKFDYDIRVGEGSIAPENIPEKLRVMWNDLSKKRIDAVGFTGSSIVVIEITRRAGIKALGQMQTYPTLYRSTYRPVLPVMPLLVAEELLCDMKAPLVNANIPYVLLPPEA